jgi:hypothetical protein
VAVVSFLETTEAEKGFGHLFPKWKRFKLRATYQLFGVSGQLPQTKTNSSLGA